MYIDSTRNNIHKCSGKAPKVKLIKRQFITPTEKFNSLNPSVVRFNAMLSISSNTLRIVADSPRLNWAAPRIASWNLALVAFEMVVAAASSSVGSSSDR